MKTQQRAYNACLQRLDNLLRLKLAHENTDGSLVSDEECTRQKARLQEHLRDADARVEQWLDTTEKTFLFACHAQEWFAHGTLDDKRQILVAIGSNPLLTDKKLSIEATKPFFVLEKGLQALPTENGPFEPHNHGSTEPQYGHSVVPISSWRALVDNVRTSVLENKDILAPLAQLLERVGYLSDSD